MTVDKTGNATFSADRFARKTCSMKYSNPDELLAPGTIHTNISWYDPSMPNQITRSRSRTRLQNEKKFGKVGPEREKKFRRESQRPRVALVKLPKSLLSLSRAGFRLFCVVATATSLRGLFLKVTFTKSWLF